MTGAVIKWACIYSSNQLQFSFPYSGGSTAELCLRDKGGKKDAYVTIDKGQFMCSYDGCAVRVKFDDGPVRTFSADESNSGSSNILFIEGYGTLLASLRKAKHIKLQARFYQEGEMVMQFDTAGLSWN